MLTNAFLDRLVVEGDIVAYNWTDVDSEGKPGVGESRNTQLLTIRFPSGRTIAVTGFCSGSRENTMLAVASGSNAWRDLFGTEG
jgi:hypothetical protein